MKFLFVIDPIENLKLESDSTIEIMQECASSGIDVFYCELGGLYFLNNSVHAQSTQLKLVNKGYTKIKKIDESLDFFDCILMRKEPPYDLTYHYATMLLEKTKVPVINRPQGLRDANEKLIILNFLDLTPKTIVTQDKERLLNFVKVNEKIVLKPIDLFGGRGVIALEKTDPSLKKKINDSIKKNGYVIAQEFIGSVYQGDKRIIVLNGEPIGAIIRIPKKGDFRANLALGGTPKPYMISQTDKKAIKKIAPYLKSHGLDLVGVDMIGDKLIEINVTCPTGLVPIKRYGQQNITRKIVEFLKSRIKTS